jgi:hypothetical protein
MKADAQATLSCPVCRARFRGLVMCSRCGADLAVLMLLAAQAYRLRQTARHSLKQGNCQGALACVQAAQRLHPTAEGSLLEWICAAASS